MQQTTSTIATNTNDTLYQHSMKPGWGVALMAWERDGKRGYQFEDGKLRVIKKGFYHLLRQIDRPADETETALRDLNLKLGRRRASKRLGADRVSIPLADQIVYFRRLFPKGFQGVKWAKKHRGIDAKKRLKRHRDPIIADAAALADRAALEARVEAGDALSVIRQLTALLEDTDMVTRAQLKGIDRVNEPLAAQLVSALINLMWGTDELDKRFNRWVGALGRVLHSKPRWQLATVISALMAPREHVCVKRSVFVKQAAWMAPSLQISTAPTGAIYVRLIEMSKLLDNKLAEHGLRVRDLIDVYDFVNATLRPKAVSDITAAMRADETDADSAAA